MISKRTLVLAGLGTASIVAGYAATGALLGTPEVPPSADQVAEATAHESADTGHSHAVRDVADTASVPEVSHLVFPDAVDGYNIQVLTRNFRFTPAAINGAVEDNAGHAHVYVNGTKVMRVYSEWVHLSGQVLQPGVNLVTVTLNANDHSTWGMEGAPIASSVRVVVPDARDS